LSIWSPPRAGRTGRQKRGPGAIFSTRWCRKGGV
jgi:hypothetical protein